MATSDSSRQTNSAKNQPPSSPPKSWYKSKRIWLAILVVFYSVFGWFILPSIVKTQLVSNLKTIANWDTSVANVSFNPYALALELNGVEISNDSGSRVVGLERLYVNFELIRSLSGTVSFGAIELEKPFIQLNLDEQGQNNFQKAFASNAAESAPAEEPSSDPIKLYFGHIAIDNGQIDIEDRSLGEPFELSFTPLGLELKEFYTHNNDGGDYALNVSLGKGQQLRWKGQIGIAPFQSKGQLALKNIRPETFWHYAKAHSPYWLHDARISFDGYYHTQADDDNFTLNIDDAIVSIDDLALAVNKDESDFITLAQIKVGPIAFDLGKQSAALGTILIDSPDISLIQNTLGELNALKPFVNNETPAETQETSADLSSDSINKVEGSSKAFAWKIDEIVLQNGALYWEDQNLNQTAKLKIGNINASLKELSQDLSVSFPYTLNFSVNESPHQIAGLLAPSPLKTEGTFAIQQLPLDIVQNYISEQINIQVNSGHTSLKGDFKLAMADTLSGTINADFSLDQLALSDSQLAKPLTGFEQLAVGPIKIELSPLDINIGTIALNKPYADVFVTEQGQMNLALLSPPKTSAAERQTALPEESGDAPIEAKATADSPPNIFIAKFSVAEGRFGFSDASQNPPFKTYFDQVTGDISGLSSDPEIKSIVDIRGKLETFGSLNIGGTLNPLSSKPNSLLNIGIQNIDLSTVSTYSSRYMGYPIDKGKLNLDLKYAIKAKHIDADNHIIINQLELGDSVDSPDSLGLPLPLAIGLLENTSNVIDINLPIAGDLDDPGFSIGSIVLTAFTNLITKAIASPFTILGSVIKGADDISAAEFAPGKSDIDVAQGQRLALLVQALNKRPNLVLEIRGTADKTNDTMALKQQRIQQALASIGGNALSSREQLLAQWGQQQKVSTIRNSLTAPEIGQAKHLAQLDAALQEASELEDLAFIGLAKERASAIVRSLTEQSGIDTQRIYVLEPQVISSGKSSEFVASPFSVNIR